MDRHRSVLLVDDDATQLKLTKLRLSGAGFEVRTATNAREAMLQAQQATPDVILSDVLMEEVDGFGFCRMLRNDPALNDVPVILLSSHYDSAPDQQLARRVGANALVARSADFDAELDALTRTLRGELRRAAKVTDQDFYEDRLRSSATQLVKLLEQTRAAEQRYRTLFDRAHDAIAVVSLDGVILEANSRWGEVLGVATEDLIGTNIRAFQVQEIEEATMRRFNDAAKRGEPWAQSVALRTATGATIHMAFSASAIEIDGQPCVLSIARDVTQQVKDATRLAAAEEKYRSLVERLPDVIWTSAQDGSITFVTPNVAKILGYTPEEIYAETAHERATCVHPEERARVQEAFLAFTQHGTPFDLEYRRKHKGGDWIWVRNRATSAFEIDGHRYVEGVITDISDRKRLEDSLRQAQKMEAIALLTGGIAHDFNNILSVILANSEFIIQDLPEHDARRSDAEEIRTSAERAAALTRQLLAFSRRQVLEPRVVNLGTVVEGLKKMLPRLLGEDIQLSTSSPADLGAVRVDIGQIEQVIMNLAVNARDAMPDGGQLSIETANVELDDALLADQCGPSPGRYVMLAVSDTGHGMDADTRRRIFEPFFTTKEMGRGTGLGLSTCYGIVKQSGGNILVYSEPGRGATFKVFLPRVEAEVTPRAAHSEDKVDLQGKETILMVEDDAEVRAAVARMLVLLGYEVLTASGFAEAIELAQQHGERIDLVLSDVILPTSNGPEIVSAARMHAGEVAALFMSGYTDHAIFRSGALEPGMNFIQKPFNPLTLARKLREILDESVVHAGRS